jgi:malonyl CoA-acyl carrier protein transacylase
MPARELDPDLPEKPPPAWAAQVAVRIMPSVVTRQTRGRQVALAGFSLGLLAAGMIGGWGVGSALAPARGNRCFPTPEHGRPRHPCR